MCYGVIDGMAANKMNRLHIHATDAQSCAAGDTQYPKSCSLRCLRFFLDCGFGAFYDPIDHPSNPIDDPKVNPPYLDYYSPYKNWRHIYSHDPLAGIQEEQKHLVLGVEVHLWGEMTDPSTLDGIFWLRTAAAVELIRRGPGTPVSEYVTRRLAGMRERLVQMEWCLRNQGKCVV